MSKAAMSVMVGFVVLVGILGYDFYLYLEGGTEATISWMVYENSYSQPIIPFLSGLAIGIFCGHLFWQMKKPNQGDKKLK